VIEALPGLADVITAKIPPSLLLKAGLKAAYSTFGSCGETRKSRPYRSRGYRSGT
jgi:hypothetical protein